MSIVALRPHLYRLLLGRWQAYLWHDADGTTLIDTGERGAGAEIVAGLREVGLAPKDVDRVVLTHFHHDHTGSAAEIRSWGPVHVVAHTLDAPVIEGRHPGPPPNFTAAERELHDRVAAGLPAAPPVAVDQRVRDGDVLDFGGGARVISTPGHTDGSLALYLPEHGVLLTGDILAEYQGEVILGVFNLDVEVAAESFRRLAELPADVACFGHGEPMLAHASERLEQVAARLPA